MAVGRSRRLPDWAVAPVGMVITTAALGGMLAFNVFLKALVDEFGWERGPTASAQSLGMVALGLTAPLIGHLADRYGARPLATAGGALIGVGYVLLSRVGELWQLYALYIALGVGTGATFVPVVGVVSRRFQQRRGLALGVGVSGITLGMAVVPLFSSAAISALGWRQAYVWLGVGVGALVLALGQLMGGKPQVSGRNPAGGLSLPQAAATGTFWKAFLAAGLCLAGVHLVLSHLVAYATDLGLSAAQGASLASLVGLGGFGGMLAMGALCDRSGPRPPWALCASISILTMAWLTALGGTGMVYPFALLFGFAWGGYAVLIPALVAQFFGVRSVAAVVGGVQLGAAVISSTGPMLAGFIFDRTGSYTGAFVAGMAMFASAAVLILAARPVPGSWNCPGDGCYHGRYAEDTSAEGGAP